MRVITGKMRGMRLQTLDGEAVRPTSEKTKEAIFSAIQFDIEGRRVLDLFAGSGQLGIEAISRGAQKAVFIDASQESIDVIKNNIKKTGIESQVVVCKTDFLSFIKGTKEVFDICFIDPPYNKGYLQTALNEISSIMSDYGIIVCEHASDEVLPEKFDKFSIYRQYKYGKLITVTIYKTNRE